MFDDIEMPPEMRCPITHEVMREPYHMPDGHCYEKEAIKKALSINPISPITKQKMKFEDGHPDYALKNLIEQQLMNQNQLNIGNQNLYNQNMFYQNHCNQFYCNQNCLNPNCYNPKFNNQYLYNQKCNQMNWANQKEFYSDQICNMKIIIKNIDDHFYYVNTNENKTIKQLKQKIFDLTGVIVDFQILIFNEKILANEKTIKSYDIHENSIIKLVHRQKGGF